jgi:lipopolysaccharide transport system permease protein
MTTPQSELTEIRPSGRWVSIDLRELWNYRELLYFLTWRDVKIRYKQTAIGILWAVLQPVLTTAIFTVIFSNFARFDTKNVPYPVFALSGLMIWLFVHSSVTLASSSFVSNTNLVTKVYFPRLLVPLAAVLAGTFDLIFSLILLILMMVYYGIIPTFAIFLVPLFLIIAIVVAASFGTLFAALNVRFCDVKFALPFLLQVWMIASPIFYPANLLTETWRLVFAANPLTGIIEGMRSALFGTAFDWQVIGVSLTSTVVFMLLALFVFKQMEDDFADLI